MNPLIILFATAILVWLSILTVFFVKIYNHYKNLIKGVEAGNLETILRKVLERSNLNKKEIVQLGQKILSLEKENLRNLQKVGFVRFNPFNETGGDNSFTLALLDAEMSGIVMTGLHTREKTRVYAKKIEDGKSKYELSKEEQKAIKEAIK